MDVQRAVHDQAARTAARGARSARGVHRLFVPVCEGKHVRQMLVAGPFLRRPSGRRQSGRAVAKAHRSIRAHRGSEFARYALGRLSTVVFDDAQVEMFKKFGERLALLIAGQSDSQVLVPELEKMGKRLADATFASRMWEAARTMVDPNTARTWASPLLVDQLAELNLTRVPEQAMVALVTAQREDSDPVEELVRRDWFQRACLALARKRGNVACGQIGDYGVMFLLPRQRSAAKSRAEFLDLATEATGLARKIGLGCTSVRARAPTERHCPKTTTARSLRHRRRCRARPRWCTPRARGSRARVFFSIFGAAWPRPTSVGRSICRLDSNAICKSSQRTPGTGSKLRVFTWRQGSNGSPSRSSSTGYSRGEASTISRVVSSRPPVQLEPSASSS